MNGLKVSTVSRFSKCADRDSCRSGPLIFIHHFEKQDMTAYAQLVEDLCQHFGMPSTPDADLWVLETDLHSASVSPCLMHSETQGVLIQVLVREMPETRDESAVDALRLLHRLNHDARFMTPWRIVLSEEGELLITQTQALTHMDTPALAAALTDGLERADLLNKLLDDWLAPATAELASSPMALPPHVIFG